MTTKTTTVAPHPSRAATNYGRRAVIAATQQDVEESYDAYTALLSLAEDGKVPQSFLAAITDYYVQVQEARKTDSPVPLFGFGMAQLPKELNRIIAAIKSGELKLDPNTGLPVAENNDTSNILGKFEQQVGWPVVVSDSKEKRTNDLLAEIKKLKESSGSADDSDIVKALGLKSGASRADIIKVCEDYKKQEDESKKLLENGYKIPFKDNESVKDYIARVFAMPKSADKAGFFGRKGAK